jgi:D-alanyl-D-alanine endopeptidase (penicillin-binding protein 7)
MILKLFSQLVLTTTLFQFFPVDASRIEIRALESEGQKNAFDVLSSYEREGGRLPVSADLVPTKVNEQSLGVVTEARSAVVIDRHSKEVLFEKNIFQPRSIGSITKLMTAFIFVSGNPDMNAGEVIIAEDVRLGATMHLPVGEEFTVRQLLEASLVGSDNTATSAIARLSGMSESDFVASMNETAAEIGMQNTTFDDTTGLSSKNRSVVTDIALMLDTVFANEIIREITQQASVSIKGGSGRVYTIKNTDELLNSFVNENPYSIVGAKTGFIPEAGYCLGTIFSREGAGEVIVVVLGSESKSGRFQDVKSLAVWAYDTFAWPFADTKYD